jgi:nucleoside-triphosphatase THEP1
LASTENRPRIALLTGGRGAGKTTWMIGFAEFLSNQNKPHFGVVSPKIVQNDENAGIAVRDLLTGEETTLAKRDDASGTRLGPWLFLPEGIALANRALSPEGRKGICLFDELGPLELRGEGFSVGYESLVNGAYGRTVVVIRPELVEKIAETIPGKTFVVDVQDTPRYQDILFELER